MKGTVTKIASVVLAASLLLAGCNNSNNNASGNDSKGSTDKANKPVTFTMFSADPNPNWNNMQDDVGKEITKKTGVTLDAEFAMDSNKISLIAASGDYPDLILPKSDANLLVNAGALIDLTDLIDKYGPNLKKVYGKYMNRLRWSNDDHAIYILPSLTGVDNATMDAGGVFELQHAVVKEQGYPTIRTLQDYENAIKAYVAKHPKTNGQKTLGLSLLADDWRIMISVTNPAFVATGAPDDGEYYIDPQTYEAKLHYKRPEEKEYFRWLNHMNAIGLLDPESFVQKYDQYKSKIASGRVVGLIDAKWEYNDGESALKTAGKFDQTYGHYPVTLNEEIKDHSFQDTGYMAGWGIGISKDCKDPVRAIKFLDWLASDEGQILNSWGIEGKQYKVENGKRVIPADVLDRKNNDATNFSKQTGIGMYNISARYGDGVKDSTGNYYTTNFPEQVVNTYSDVEKEVLKAYGKTTWKDFYPQASEFPVKPWGAAWNIAIASDSQVNIIYKKVETITRKRIPEIVLAKPGKFDQVWDAFMKDLDKAGADKMEKGYTKLVKERVKLWSDDTK